jgi:ribosomal 50S subunit-recycling heat shock protein
MKTKIFGLIAVVTLALSGATFGAGVSDYQVTGPVTEVDSSKIVLEKGAKKERFEIARDSNSKADTEPKVGDKVTVHYTMTATTIEVKAGKRERRKKRQAQRLRPSRKLRF